MNEIIIASTTTIDRLDKVYILFNSIKKTKNPETKITYYLFVPCNDINYCIEYFKPLVSTDFYVVVSNLDIFAPYVHTPARNHVYYAKCLFPSYFTQYKKILYLDVDMVFVNKGIEALWNEDITDSYVGACIDVAWQYCPVYCQDIPNTKTKNYFNAGMMLLNLERIREEEKAKELRDWCVNWNLNELQCICFDQTLLNYILKDKVKIIDFKYNNTLLASDNACKNTYTNYIKSLEYNNHFESLDDAVILHFAGANKPWANIPPFNYPYKNEAKRVWGTIYNKYKKG